MKSLSCTDLNSPFCIASCLNAGAGFPTRGTAVEVAELKRICLVKKRVFVANILSREMPTTDVPPETIIHSDSVVEFRKLNLKCFTTVHDVVASMLCLFVYVFSSRSWLALLAVLGLFCSYAYLRLSQIRHGILFFTFYSLYMNNR